MKNSKISFILGGKIFNLVFNLLIDIYFVLIFFFQFHSLKFDFYINFDIYSFDYYLFFSYLEFFLSINRDCSFFVEYLLAMQSMLMFVEVFSDTYLQAWLEPF